MDFKKLANTPSCTHDVTEEKEKGPHIGVYCVSCGIWMQWKPKPVDYTKWKTYKMPFGKHEGETLDKIPIHYLKWGAENMDDDPVLQKYLQTAFEARSKKKARNYFPPVNGKDIYKLVDQTTDEILIECQLNDIKNKVKEVWPKYVMPHPGFIMVGNAVVGRLEFVKKAEKKSKSDKGNSTEESLLFD